MAENQAATATASAQTGASPASAGLQAKPTAAKPVLSPELSASPSFDVEEFLAGPGQEAGTAETNTDAGTDEEQAAPTGEEATETDTATAEGDDETESTAPEGEESEDEAKAEDEDTPPEGLKPKAIKRFDKLLKQRDEALAARRALEAQNAELKAKLDDRQDEPPPVKTSSDPLAAVTNEEQLDAHEQFYRDVRSWCRRNPNGGTPPKHLTRGEEVEFSVEDVANNLDTAETMLEAVPTRRDFLAKFKATRAETRKAQPNLYTPGTVENETAKALLPRLLNFRTQADQDALLAKLVRIEMQERDEREGVARYPRVEIKKASATTAKPAAVKPAPKPAVTGHTVPPVKPANGSSPTANAWAKLSLPGSEVDVEELLAEA